MLFVLLLIVSLQVLSTISLTVGWFDGSIFPMYANVLMAHSLIYAVVGWML